MKEVAGNSCISRYFCDNQDPQSKLHNRDTIMAVLYSMAITCVVLLAVFLYKGFYPLGIHTIGKGSVMQTDMYSQYIPLLYRFYDVVMGRKNLFLEFDILAGANLYADTINEIINPFNYVLFLFGRDKIYYAVNIILILYVVCMAGSSSFVLNRLFCLSTRWSALMGVCYALCGYTAYNYQIIKWMYLPIIFPFFFFALIRMLQGRSAKGYAILLAYQLMLSIQLGFMTLLFCLFAGGIYAFFCLEKEEKRKRLTTMCLYTIIGVMLSLVVTLPMFRVLLESSRAGQNQNYFGVMKQHGLDDLFERVFQFGHPLLFGLYAVRMFFCFRKKSLKEFRQNKELCFFAVLTVFLYVTALVQPVNLLWHMGSYVCFPVRYGYMIMFVSCAFAAKWQKEATDIYGGGADKTNCALTEEPDLENNHGLGRSNPNPKSIYVQGGLCLITACIATGMVCIREAAISEAFSCLAISLTCKKEAIYFAVVIMILILAAVMGLWKRNPGEYESRREKPSPVFLVSALSPFIVAIAYGVVVFMSVCLSRQAQIRRWNEDAYLTMSREYDDKSQTNQLDGETDSVFYRTGESDSIPLNAALVNGNHSLSGYVPTGNGRYQETMNRFGYETSWVSVSAAGGSAFFDELLSGVCVLTDENTDYVSGNASGTNITDTRIISAFDGNVNVDVRKAAIHITVNRINEKETLFVPVSAVDGWTLYDEKEQIIGRTSDQPYANTYGDCEGICMTKEYGSFIGLQGLKDNDTVTLRFQTPGLKCGALLAVIALILWIVTEAWMAGVSNRFTLLGLYRVTFLGAVIGIYIIPTLGMLIFMTGKLIKTVSPFEVIAQREHNLLQAVDSDEGIYVEIAGKNLLLDRSVKITADSVEGGRKSSFSPKKVNDGITEDISNRWSSENNWENNEHFIAAQFAKPMTVGYVVLTWERDNALEYAIECSDDGKEWTVLEQFETKPESLTQRICFSQPVTTGNIRLHVTKVRKEEDDLSLYYQNVSLLEMEVYEGIENAFSIEPPLIQDGDRRWLTGDSESVRTDDSIEMVPYPYVPEGYSLQFVSADYEELVNADGRIATTTQEREVALGFCLTVGEDTFELPALRTTIPASESYTKQKSDSYILAEQITVEAGNLFFDRINRESGNRLIAIFEEEWNRLSAQEMDAEKEPLIDKKDELFSETEVMRSNTNNKTIHRIVLQLKQEEDYATEWTDYLGKEGYEIAVLPVDEKEAEGEAILTISANGIYGLRYGWEAVKEMYNDGMGCLSSGIIRDFPKYEVRGFGIDVARRQISMEMLYRIVHEMSKYRMNTLLIHLNDNEIIANHPEVADMEDAYALYSAFRMESDIKNDEGVGITATDYYYTKSEFKDFIEEAQLYGVKIVPEIDTPAHSLSFTRVFPNLALSGKAEVADQMKVNSQETIDFAKQIWGEYLTDVFASCDSIHLGMDEYYGESDGYVRYMQNLNEYVHEEAYDKQVIVWGSLSAMKTDYSQLDRNITMQVWDTDWADPEEMVQDGFSIINSLSCRLYIIPGGGYDYLDEEYLENEWQPYRFDTAERIYEIPSWSSKVKGACYMLWNDFANSVAGEYSDESLFDRFSSPLPIIAKKLW